GVTNNLERRMWEHKNDAVQGFSNKYRLNKLLYFEHCTDANEAISREKQLKNWHRKWKFDLVKKDNPGFLDLSENWLTKGSRDPESSSG
ncbi:GIY-YIG nuclease family protein, partial [Elusimicrobiota bacterium]